LEAKINQLRAEGKPVPVNAPGYASIHIPASTHVRYLCEAGFQADVIWRKMEFVILAGIKGAPFRAQHP
jgi:hypothetical protein